MWFGELAIQIYVSNIFFLSIVDATISQASSIQSMFIIQAFEQNPTTQEPLVYKYWNLSKWINPYSPYFFLIFDEPFRVQFHIDTGLGLD